MAFSIAMGFHKGEEQMHKLMQVPVEDNPSSAMLTPQASYMLQRAPLLAIGTLDAKDWPWTTLWGGTPGFSEPLGAGFVGTKTLVDSKFDPVVQALVGNAEKGQLLQPTDGGKMLSALAIDLVTRKRVKIAGKMAAGTVREVDVNVEGDTSLLDDVPKTQNEIQLVTKIDESLGNCPKYLNQYSLTPALVTPELVHEGPSLSPEGRALIDRADMFFLSTATDTDMDTNHRGGPPGFIRTVSPSCIVYPEYSGNRLYQSLGNLLLNPRIGITIPDYAAGTVLYTTGTATVLAGPAAQALLPGSPLVVKIQLEHTRLVARGLPFRGALALDGYSPYNPRPRPLASERTNASVVEQPDHAAPAARLLSKTRLAPTITRYEFAVQAAPPAPGQWAALSFAAELDEGYSHMRPGDPRALNDDFVRTFTVSAAPSFSASSSTSVCASDVSDARLHKDETPFTITLRTSGRITRYLTTVSPSSPPAIALRGFGGSFHIAPEAGLTPFIAGGVGITPLLAFLPALTLTPQTFHLFWALRADDAGFALDTFARHPRLAHVTDIFVSGTPGPGDEDAWTEVAGLGARVWFRRMRGADVEGVQAGRWYLCAGGGLRREAGGWLEGREVVVEDFGF
ncbi:hypothetical protein C7974DRAFT_424361 [Boeremia exigua]|uniref:uncharacterized protein n=1 Tax=Boeremia exigua TaxID=749465 RepID=UPI001E8EDB4A|nr:uncharacterized protein C7974DRAFT_424361 [Boeremia exigua]KAH6629294.1 hypothetical protein C7974DRAFT_424361 [Boeremia exigua]